VIEITEQGPVDAVMIEVRAGNNVIKLDSPYPEQR